MSPKFIIDEFGNKTEVILSINDFNELIEELEDLKDIKIREKDELIDHSKALELLGLWVNIQFNEKNQQLKI